MREKEREKKRERKKERKRERKKERKEREGKRKKEKEDGCSSCCFRSSNEYVEAFSFSDRGRRF